MFVSKHRRSAEPIPGCQFSERVRDPVLLDSESAN